MSRFSQSLSQILTSLRWNQQEFAEKAGTDQSKVSRWLNGTVTPKPDALPAIVKPFDRRDRSALVLAYIRDLLPEELLSLLLIEPLAIDEELVVPQSLEEQSIRYNPPPEPPEGISKQLLARVYRVAEVARDVPEVEAIFTEFDRLIAKAKKAGRL